MQAKFLDDFIEHLIEESDYIKSETAFKIKIRKLFAKEDKEQLEEFEKWYLETECNRLEKKYKGKEMSFHNADTYIESIYPYFDTTGYNKEDKLYMCLKIKASNETYKIMSFVNADEAENYLIDNCEPMEKE